MRSGNPRSYLRVSGAIFGFVSLVHLVRAVNGWTFVIGPAALPLYVSWAGFIVAGVMCAWAFRLAAQ